MYKLLIINELKKLLDQNPNMTFAQAIHSTITSRDVPKSPLEWLFEVEDEDFYTAVQNAIEKENE